jgi:hypothetical protein
VNALSKSPLDSTAFVFRPAWEDEIPRVTGLVPGMANAGGYFVALRERPVERLVGAAGWREIPSPDGGLTTEFRWGALPVLAGTPAERDFVEAFVAMLATQAEQSGRAAQLRSFEPLPDGREAQLLQELGFTEAYRHECYVSSWDDWKRRTDQLLARLAGKYADQDGQVLAPAAVHGEALVELAARRHNLIGARDIHSALTSVGGNPKFDPRYSAVLMEGERLAGACLTRLHAGQIAIPVLVVDPAASMPGGVVCARLFALCQQALKNEGAREVYYRTNPEMSPGMPRLARRFDARHIATLKAWRLALGTKGVGGA